ncbi:MULTISPECIES: hypothetical protein [Bacillati]|uniref:hypothetical protein n=1 Tax=Bacillati TaxID=1783272 RepID=UPI0033D7155A
MVKEKEELLKKDEELEKWFKEHEEIDKEIERVLKEKGIDCLTRREREISERYLNYEPSIFDKELYKKLAYTEKMKAYFEDTRAQEAYDSYLSSIRYGLRGEVFNPFGKSYQNLIEPLSDGTLLRFALNDVLKLEHELKQKYNEEGE